MKKILLFITTILVFSYCKNTPTQQGNTNKTGKELAQLYCSNCHMYPEPALLDKTAWMTELLPNMSARLGMTMNNYNPYAKVSPFDKMMIEVENIYPKTPLLSPEDWAKIVAFYQSEAPDMLPKTDNNQAVLPLKGFDIKTINILNFQPLVTFTKINSFEKLLYIGSLDGKLSTFSTKNKDLTLQNTYNISSPPVSILQPNDAQMLILGVGQIHPNEQQEGRVFQLDKTNNQTLPQVDMLKRPVYFTSSDEGKTDMLICEYGYQKGQLSYFKKENNRWKGQILSDTAGATKALPYDFNKDGLMDFAVLMAQGDERIVFYYAQKSGGFQAKQVLQFPPIYGSSDIQLVDFDKNGTMDILYTNGDNEDFSPVLKPYHGIRVYLNDGKDNYTEGVFYPLYGAFQAKAADFDNDGDMDIVTTSFFPSDKTKPEAHFRYLEQTQPFQFKAYTFKEATQGKWMTLDVGDADGDGDMDILLGSFVISLAGNSKSVDKKEKVLPFLFLENTTK
jgi:hypothetical protein